MTQPVQRLPFFASPLTNPDSGISHNPDLAQSQSIDQWSEPSAEELATVDLKMPINEPRPEWSFHRHTNTTPSELFYDLFFVANLTVFSTVKEINDLLTLKQYIGFFTILWFTWYQVSLYDLRFSVDSVCDRFAKALQFGVMIGFAICGPTFGIGAPLEEIIPGQKPTLEDDPQLSTLKSVTCIMAVSRAVLVFQYLQAVWLCRSRRQLVRPMLLIAATEAFASAIYLGLFYAFDKYEANAYWTWYAVAILETTICTLVSSMWREVSFKGTHLVQRMNLLTLIVMGEGIMKLAHECQTIVKGQIFGFSVHTVTNIISCVLIMYFIHMIYFHWISEEGHMGTIRQQIWGFAHFPLHLALVVCLDGSSQWISWRAATTRTDALFDRLGGALDFDTAAAVNNSLAVLSSTANEILTSAVKAARNNEQITQYSRANSSIIENIDALRELSQTGLPSSNDAIGVANAIAVTLTDVIYAAIGFEPPAREKPTHSTVLEEQSGDQFLQAVFDRSVEVEVMARLVFIYFFVTVGAVVILSALLSLLSNRDKHRGQWIRLCTHIAVGMFLALFALCAVRPDGQVFTTLVYSSWILPITALALLFVVIVDNVRLPRRIRERFAKKQADDKWQSTVAAL